MGEQKRRYDARNGVERTMIFDDASTTFTVHHQQDVEPILDGDRPRSRDDAARRQQAGGAHSTDRL